VTDLKHPDLVPYGQAKAMALQAMRALPPMNLPDFSERHFFLPPGSSGIPGPWVNAPFQRGIMLVIGHDDARRVVIQKPARVGYTKILAASLVYFASRRRRSTCLWQPTDSDSMEFVRDEIDPLFEYVPVFGDALLTDPDRDKDPRNTVHRKEFAGANLHFKGGKSASNYRRMTLDVALLDEYDGFDAVIRGADGKAEGSAAGLAEVRVTDSPYGRMVLGSTPTVKGASQIESELAACECVLERYVRCPRCEHMQRLEWGSETTTHGMKWDHGEPKTARYICESCHGSMEWGDINLIDAGGYWASERLRLDDSGDGEFFDRVTGEPAAFPETIGFKFSTLISPFYSWPQMVKSFLEAKDQIRREGDSSKMMVFVNTRLGETWVEGETVMQDPMKLMQRAEIYASEVPLGVVAITAGVDVQIDRLEIEFRGWGAGEESWGLQYVKLVGDTSQVPGQDLEGEVSTVYDQLERLLNRTFTHPVYGEMQITLACIDSGYQTSNIYEFCARNPKTWIPVKGAGGAATREVVDFSGKVNDRGVYLAIVGSDNAMDVIHTRLGLTEDGPGCYHWPKDSPGFGEMYFRQLLAEQRVKKMKAGRPYWTWVCPPNARNEPADTAKYNLAAIKLAQIAKGIVLHKAPEVDQSLATGAEAKLSPLERMKAIARSMNKPGET